jgi:hypothetical protein
MKVYTVKGYRDNPETRPEVDALLELYGIEDCLSIIVGPSLIWFKVLKRDETGSIYRDPTTKEVANETVKRKKVH